MENKEFRILSAFGILFVVAGHLNYDLFTVGGLFPYYSFHVFIFLFVSGYFYNEEAEKHVISYFVKKCLSLLLPYYIWNLVYGIVAFLLHGAGFSIGQELSVYTLLLAPFDGGHQFMYQYPSWFVPVLFIIEMINVMMRKVLSWFRLNNEWLILAGCLAAGILTVWLAIGNHVWGWYKIPGRILFMLPGFQFGRIYREKLEKKDVLPNGIYFIIVMTIQVIIHICTGGRLAFGAVWVNNFACGPIVPYLTVITGIAFWLRIAKCIKDVPFFATGLVTIGRNTYSIMMHHIFACFMVKAFCFMLHKLTGFCSEFDCLAFQSDVNYLYLPGGAEAAKWIYLSVGIGLPIWIASLQKKGRAALWK